MSVNHLPDTKLRDGTSGDELFEHHHAPVCSYRDVDATAEGIEEGRDDRWGGEIGG